MRTLGFLKTQRGISMVEVFVTIVITSVGLLGLNSLQLQASRSTLDSGNRSQAVWVLEDLTNRMRANIVGIEHYGTGSTAMKCGGTMPTMCSSYHDGSNKVLAAANCGNEEQAKSDLHEVLCGFGARSEEHTSELQSRPHLVCRLLLDKKNVVRINLLEVILCFSMQSFDLDFRDLYIDYLTASCDLLSLLLYVAEKLMDDWAHWCTALV